MNVLLLYNSLETYANTVYEHLSSFKQFSKNNIYYCHISQHKSTNVDFNLFDTLIFHYTVRLPYDQFSNTDADRISNFRGLKVLFIQDEYDNTFRTWYWIKRLGIQLVFTVVPQRGIETVYPNHNFPDVRFVTNLTGYAPENLFVGTNTTPPSKRKLLIGYRGRPLPAHYGLLGREKIAIGKLTKEYCSTKMLPHDIEWSEESRIYGHAWYEFISSCRSMLGSESGSNVFDWDGTLASQIASYKQQHPTASDDELYSAIIEQHDQHGLMNQISPRVFESIAFRTVLVLFEGEYSGILSPGVHYIPLRKDGSNLDEVHRLLVDAEYVDAMAERAYTDIIASGKYSYRSFVQMVDTELQKSFAQLGCKQSAQLPDLTVGTELSPISTTPIRALPPLFSGQSSAVQNKLYTAAYRAWRCLPAPIREWSKPHLKQLLGRG